MQKKRHNLYFPPKLHEKIERLAAVDMRSFNSEVMVLLAQIVEQRREDLSEEKQEIKQDEKTS